MFSEAYPGFQPHAIVRSAPARHCAAGPLGMQSCGRIHIDQRGISKDVCGGLADVEE